MGPNRQKIDEITTLTTLPYPSVPKRDLSINNLESTIYKANRGACGEVWNTGSAVGTPIAIACSHESPCRIRQPESPRRRRSALRGVARQAHGLDDAELDRYRGSGAGRRARFNRRREPVR